MADIQAEIAICSMHRNTLSSSPCRNARGRQVGRVHWAAAAQCAAVDTPRSTAQLPILSRVMSFGAFYSMHYTPLGGRRQLHAYVESSRLASRRTSLLVLEVKRLSNAVFAVVLHRCLRWTSSTPHLSPVGHAALQHRPSRKHCCQRVCFG